MVQVHQLASFYPLLLVKSRGSTKLQKTAWYQQIMVSFKKTRYFVFPAFCDMLYESRG